jgi:HK97 family phage major capsid protein
MSYTNSITRSAAEALIPEDVARDIMKAAPEQSIIMQLGRRLPNMSHAQRKMPVLSALISGGFVEGDTGLKQTSAAAWRNKTLTAAEIAVIVPIPEAVLDDADYDIWGQIRPQIVEEFGRIFDSAVLFGTDKPADWPESIVAGATAAGHVIDYSDEVSGGNDLYDMVLGEDGALSFVEADGYLVNGHVAAMPMRAKLRGLRDTTKQPIFLRSAASPTRYELDGEPIYFPKNGAMDPTSALMISGANGRDAPTARDAFAPGRLDVGLGRDSVAVLACF